MQILSFLESGLAGALERIPVYRCRLEYTFETAIVPSSQKNKDCPMKLPKIFAISIAVMLAGCNTLSGPQGTLNISAFAKFTTSVEELQSGTDDILDGIVEQSEARFRAELAADIKADDADDDEIPETLKSLLRIQFVTDDDRFGIKNEPYFLRLPSFKLAMYQSNNALVGYAQVLEQLADPALINPESIDKITANLNANAKSAALAINPEMETSDQGNVAVISSVAGKLLRRSLEGSYKRDLVAVVEENQPTIEAYAAHLQQGTRVLAAAVQNEFQQEVDSYVSVFADTDQSNSKRIMAAMNMVGLIKERLEFQETLLKIHAAYGRLPAAHAELGSFKPDVASELANIIALTETAVELKTTYETVVTEARKQHLQLEVDQAEAVASAAELAASRLAVDLAYANLNLERATAALEGDPDDAGLIDAVADHEQTVATLETAHDEQLDEAKALRVAANAVEDAARELADLIQ